MQLLIKTLVGEDCITLEDGEKVYDRIHPELLDGRPVEVDFAGVGVFASTFFNAAFGRLLKDLTAETLNRLLTVTHITPDGLAVLRIVIENSTEYYTDPGVRKAVDAILNEPIEDR